MACRLSLLIVNEPPAGCPRKYKDGYYKAARVLRNLEENLTERRQIKREEG